MDIHKKIALLISCIVISPIHTKDLSEEIFQTLLIGGYTALAYGIVNFYLRQPSQAELQKMKIAQEGELEKAKLANTTALYLKEKASIEYPVSLLDKEGNNLNLVRRIKELDVENKKYTILLQDHTQKSIQSLQNLLKECQHQYHYPDDKNACESIKKLLDATVNIATASLLQRE